MPRNTLVAKHIACYYFHWSDDDSFKSTFTFYPNYKHALTIYKDSEVVLGNNSSLITPLPGAGFSMLYAVNTRLSLNVHLKGRFYKTGVVFNPLGINHFLSKPLSEVFSPAFSTFPYFGQKFENILAEVYATTDIDAKAALLDHFFVETYTGFNDPIVKQAMQEILNSNGTVRVEELSDNIGINRKTLLRLFKKHLCASVEEYKKLVMFRNALNYSQQAGSDVTLTDVALYSLYYDQAHFIKHFKSVTHQPPKELLHNLTRLGGQEAVYWHFEN